ncbi:hypothetical protein KTO58_09560 [Chitinophaga pendula]|uniref:GNAT family N-acetyltransferase n=1 Tax=Chitinophaga TaxID=79328 RepID=UPI000BAE6F1E|nr:MULTISPECIES: GNAT family N-acetyltransferase [Chitinophaga]ASZ12958.1 GNAT family N-acetyltransferase [Chitinophaga sp. MD30]UCJ09410.1 hypothetical protein KTO58_09560 [Chitinophaga pendula]
MQSFETSTLLATEAEQLLALQLDNMKEQLSAQTAASQGFLTFQYDIVTLRSMMRDMPQPVVRGHGQLVGYALAASRAACAESRLLAPLAEQCQELYIDDRRIGDLRYYIMGQICVREGWRGMGLFDALYQHHKVLFSGAYDCMVTEISAANKRSLAAHARVGFQTVQIVREGDVTWHVVAWDWR